MVLSEVASEALAQASVPLVSSSGLGMRAVDAAVDAASAWRLTRRGVLGRYQAWFSDQDEERGLEPIDVLMWLNSAYRPGARPDEVQEADDLLWRAFLADLRDNFRRTRHPKTGRGPRCCCLTARTPRWAGTFCIDSCSLSTRTRRCGPGWRRR